MPTFRQKNAIKSFKSRIVGKFNSVKQETDLISTHLKFYLEQYEKRISEVLEADKDEFYPLYQKLNQDLETFHDKIIVLQASLEICSEDDSDCENEENFQDSLLELGATAKSIEPKKYSLSSIQSIIKSNLSRDDDKSSLSVESFNEQKDSLQELGAIANSIKPQKNLLHQSVFQTNLSCNIHESSPVEFSNEQSVFKPVNVFKGSVDIVSVSSAENDFKGSDKNYDSSEKKFRQLNKEDHIDLIEKCFLERSKAGNKEKEKCSPTFSPKKVESENSFSPSSCYRSLSSNFSDLDLSQTSSIVTNTNVVCSESSQSTFYSGESRESKTSSVAYGLSLLPSKPLTLSSKIFVTLTCITNPGDFWVQLENTENCVKFPMCEHINKIHPSEVREQFLYLAPFRATSYYYRVQALNHITKGEDKVKVFYVDHGSSSEIYLKDIRQLPWIAYDTPVQAYHCCLFGVSPIDAEWSTEAVNRFEEFQNYCIEAVVKDEINKKHSVQLFARASAELSEDFSSDIALILHVEELALYSEETYATDETYSEDHQETSSPEKSNGIELPIKNRKNYLDGNKISCDSGVSVNKISYDSGVSVSSVYKSSHASHENNFNNVPLSSSKLDNLLVQNLSALNGETLCSVVKCDTSVKHAEEQTDLISFESIEKVECFTKKLEPFCDMTCDMNELDSFRKNDFMLHLKVPPPKVSFVKKNSMLVMISFIYSPSDFYVNLVMENSEKFDELREQMATTYGAMSPSSNAVSIDNVSENMFCACQYKDGFWYRARVLHVQKKTKKVTIRFVDYGNKETVDCCDLRPLTPSFANLDAFAIHCCLTGIVPKKQKKEDTMFLEWDEDAINEFKNIVTFERPLTAEVYEEVHDANYEPLQVLLWDTTSLEDVLINSLLIDKGFADVHSNLLLQVSVKEKTEQNLKEIEILNRWDPMSEQYNDIENSYGVEPDDIQVVTTGYSGKDEHYTCKYYSLRGFCPRSDCTYLHVETTESGVTRDQEEVYSFDTMPLLPKTEKEILVEVLVVKSPGNFYAVLPFGDKTPQEIDSYILNDGSYEDIIDTEIKKLHSAMSNHYSSVPFDENTAVALACGNIVVAVSKLDNQWHRGRIVDVCDVSEPVKVFFVDYGNQELVERKFVRKILPQFLHAPFQAVQCILSDVEPKDFDKGMTWSKKAIDIFEDLVYGSLLLAEITYRCGNILHVTLQKTMKNDRRKVSEILVMEECAQYVSKVTTEKKETKYVPG